MLWDARVKVEKKLHNLKVNEKHEPAKNEAKHNASGDGAQKILVLHWDKKSSKCDIKSEENRAKRKSFVAACSKFSGSYLVCHYHNENSDWYGHGCVPVHVSRTECQVSCGMAKKESALPFTSYFTPFSLWHRFLSLSWDHIMFHIWNDPFLFLPPVSHTILQYIWCGFNFIKFFIWMRLLLFFHLCFDPLCICSPHSLSGTRKQQQQQQ